MIASNEDRLAPSACDVALAAPLARLVALMRLLRAPDGCPWDRVQTVQTIAPYTIEEAYEVADACARDDMAALVDELGDLQLQVVFHAAIAADRGAFTLAEVIDGICTKMVRRHAHVFGEEPGGLETWERIKAEERAGQDDSSALAGVALALPALLRAEKLQKRAARVGFDWPDAAGPRAKVVEEMAELDDAEDGAAQIEEAGDLLFAAVNWIRHLGIDPEAALRQASAKFERRFRSMETADVQFAGRSLEEKERSWAAAKASERR